MTVSELIQYLTKFPPDLEVIVEDNLDGLSSISEPQIVAVATIEGGSVKEIVYNDNLRKSNSYLLISGDGEYLR